MSALEARIADEAKRAIGAGRETTAILSPDNVAQFRAALGLAVDGALPPLGHWAFFNRPVANDQVGHDGHPRPDGFLPRLPELSRRMFASSSIRFERALQIGQEATLTMTVEDVVAKQGSEGPLMFAKVARRIAQGGELCVDELQTLVYRPAADGPGPALPTPDPAMVDADAVWTPDPVQLFRFSCATYNCHRIHYDAAYATQVEGYPALIVHGPFVASKLALLAAKQGPLATLDFRASAPAFVDQPIRLSQTAPDTFQATRCDGQRVAAIKVSYK